jgi:hypothetical protein
MINDAYFSIGEVENDAEVYTEHCVILGADLDGVDEFDFMYSDRSIYQYEIIFAAVIKSGSQILILPDPYFLHRN